MRAVIQRVKNASVRIDNQTRAVIEKGLLIYLGIEDSDSGIDADWLSKKIANLRVFDDNNGVMNLSVQDVNGEILVISQFTLHASTRKGNRPSYIRASKPDHAIPLYEDFISKIGEEAKTIVKTGVFGAEMMVESVNDGPVTIIIDSKLRE